jgi:hypothetical protein
MNLPCTEKVSPNAALIKWVVGVGVAQVLAVGATLEHT